MSVKNERGKTINTKSDYYVVFSFIVMMSVVGFLLFDNIVATLSFGIFIGGVMGWLSSTIKKAK